MYTSQFNKSIETCSSEKYWVTAKFKVKYDLKFSFKAASVYSLIRYRAKCALMIFGKDRASLSKNFKAKKYFLVITDHVDVMPCGTELKENMDQERKVELKNIYMLLTYPTLKKFFTDITVPHKYCWVVLPR